MTQALPRKKRKRRKSNREEYVSYLVRLTGWNYHYSFSLNDPKRRWGPGPYNEHSGVIFEGDVIRPEGCKYERAIITLSARAGLLQEKMAEHPTCVGSLTAVGTELSAYVFVPAERLAELTSVAASGRVQIAQFTATKVRFRSALVRNVSLDTNFNPEDW